MAYTGKARDGSLQYQRIIGSYQDEFTRVDGEWLFKTLRVTVEEAGAYSVEASRL
jgi:hypothetical protein